jgi:hypothetical protein
MSATAPFSDSPVQTTLDAHIRTLLSAMLKRSSKSREQIADALSIRTGKKISTRQLDNWTSTARQETRRFPAALVEPLCDVLADDSLQRYVMGRRLRQLVRLGEIQIERETIQIELRKRNRGRKAKGAGR